MAEKLYQTAIDFSDLNSDSIVVMPIQNQDNRLSFAKQVKEVYGVEVIRTAVEDAENAERNGITNAHYVVDSAENAMAKWSRMASSQIWLSLWTHHARGLTESFNKASVAMQPERLPTSHVAQQQWRVISKLYQNWDMNWRKYNQIWFISRKISCGVCSIDVRVEK